MTTEKKKLDRVLHLNLEVSDDFLCVTSIDNESGETYCMDFHRGVDANGVPYHTPENIMMRVGMEVWSWIEILMMEFNSLDDDE